MLSASTHTFPEEILGNIFTMCAEDQRPLPRRDIKAYEAFITLKQGPSWLSKYAVNREVEEDESYRNQQGTLGWMRVSHVCARWRRAAIGARALWARDIGAIPCAIDEMLARAGPSRSLTVRLYGSSFREPYTDAVDVLRSGPHFPRVSEICWYETRYAFIATSDCSTIRCEEFPILNNMLVSANERLASESDGTLATWNLPVLDAVVFRGFMCAVASASITQLSLADEPMLRVTPDNLRSALRPIAATLTELAIDVWFLGPALPSALSTEIANDVIRLPRLQTLHYHNHYGGSSLPDPLSGLVYPHTTETRIEIRQRDTIPMRDVTYLIESFESVDISLSVDVWYDDMLNMVHITLCLNSLDPKKQDDPRDARDPWLIESKCQLKMHLDCLNVGYSLYASREEFLRRFLVEIPCHRVRALSLSCFRGCEIEAILLRHFSAIEYLRIINKAGKTGYSGLSICSGIVVKDTSADTTVELPRAVTLELLGLSESQNGQLLAKSAQEVLHMELEQWRISFPASEGDVTYLSICASCA